MWTEWRNKFLAALDEAVPKKIIKNNRKRKKHCPWMSPELLYLLHQQKSLHRRIKKTHHQQQDLILRHRKLKNRTNNLYRQLKNVYFQNQFHAYRRDPKTFWSTINNITGRQKANHPPPPPPDNATVVPHYFKSLLHQPGLTNALPFGPDKEDALCTFTPVTSAEVRTLLKNLVTDKAAGPDGIRPKELKIATAQISDSLSAFFNESLASGQLPEEFKSGLLLPIFKSGKTNSQRAENYRGISLTCILSKVLERIVHSQLCDHFQSSGTLSDSQYGFRRNHSCSDLLVSTIDDWLLARDRKLNTAIVFLDLKKAFDNVRHQNLLQCLQNADIGGTVLRWIHHFLTDRYYQLIGPGEPPRDSNLRFMPNKGVPQGSVLGPLLFNVYVSSLHDAARAKNVSLPSFADDFTLYSIRPTMTEAADAATSALQDISVLLEEKGLTISEGKTASMMIASSSSTYAPKPLMYLNDSPIKMESQAALLGVTVDENLTWSAHIDALHRRICRKIGVLRRTMRRLTSASRRQFLISVIHPDFEYAAVAFVHSMSMSGKLCLLALWRKAVLCAAMADWRADIAPLLVHLKINAIEHRWALQCALLVRRCHLQTAPKELLDKLHRPSHGFTTRGQGIAFKPYRPKTRSGSISFSNRAPFIWNVLDEGMKTCSSSKFRTKFLSLVSFSTALLSLTLFDPA